MLILGYTLVKIKSYSIPYIKLDCSCIQVVGISPWRNRKRIWSTYAGASVERHYVIYSLFTLGYRYPTFLQQMGSLDISAQR